MTMVSMPVDNSTLAITSIICAGLLFVFLLVAADDEFRKPPIAAAIAIIAGGLLYWLGFIPIGLMIAAALALVVGIFRALKENANQRNPSIKPSEKSTAQANEQNFSPNNHREKVERFNQETGSWEKLETDLDSQDTQPTKNYDPLLQKNFNDKPKLNLSNAVNNVANAVDEEVDLFLDAISTNKSVRTIGIFIGVMVAVGIVGFAVSMQDNKDKSQLTYIPSATTPSTTTTAAINNNQPLVTPLTEAPVNPVLMQQCDSYATANKRKEPTLTYQEQREDYSKLYEFCLDEAKKLTQTASTNTANNSNIETANNELLQAYQTARIDNETSRQYINKTWEDLIQTLPDNQKSGVLKLQRAWIKSKQNLCGKVVKNKTIDNLTSNELAAEIKLLECDSQANSERAAVLSKTTQLQDEIAKIIKEGGK